MVRGRGRPSAAAPVGQPSADAAGDSGAGSCSPLDSLVDKEAIKTQLRDIVAKAEAMKAYNDAHGLKFRMELSFVITGDSGTGKATVAATIAALLHEKGLVNNPVPKTVDPTDYQKFMDKIDENLKNFGNGVLVIKPTSTCPTASRRTSPRLTISSSIYAGGAATLRGRW